VPTSWILVYLSVLDLAPLAVEIEISSSRVWPSALSAKVSSTAAAFFVEFPRAGEVGWLAQDDGGSQKQE